MNVKLFNCVLLQLSGLSKTGDLNSSQVLPWGGSLQNDNHVGDWGLHARKCLQEYWPIKYRAELGELTQGLPKPAVLTSIKKFDPTSVFHDRQLPKQYGEDVFLRLWAWYGPSWILELHSKSMLSVSFFTKSWSLNSATIAQRPTSANELFWIPACFCFSNLCTFAKIALIIPISTAWPSELKFLLGTDYWTKLSRRSSISP